MKLHDAITELLDARLGRCAGCGAPGSWDEATHGSCNDKPAVWAGCDFHSQATSTAVSAVSYKIVANAAKANGVTIDEYLEGAQKERQARATRKKEVAIEREDRARRKAEKRVYGRHADLHANQVTPEARDYED